MYTIERALPQYEVNDCLIELAGILGDLVSDDPDDLRAIYDYRTSPQKIASASITSLDDLPFTTKFTEVHYDFMVDIVVTHDGTPDSLRAAEHRLNKLCHRAWTLMAFAESETWSDLAPARNNMKPASPPENSYIRRAFLFVRVSPI